MLKITHLLRFLHPSSLQRTCKYASLLGISGALHPGIFDHPGKNHFFDAMLKKLTSTHVNVNATMRHNQREDGDKNRFSFFSI